MKMKILMIAIILLAGAPILSNHASAQVNLSVNIGNQPAWGPIGYNHADFYYLPEVNAYYDIGRAQFVYLSGRSWTYGKNLPPQYRSINLDNTYKVVVNRQAPYKNNQDDIRQYGKYKNTRNQSIIRNSKDSKYFASYQNPQHQQWEKGNKGNGKAQELNNGRKSSGHSNSGKH